MTTIVVAIISGVFSCLATMIPMLLNNKRIVRESMICTLRNDILAIYDHCKKDKVITRYQLEAIEHSYTQYEKLGGNSFVKDLMNIVRQYDIID